MDFKSLLNKLDSMEAPAATPKAPTLPASVRLDEDAQLRVLAGTSTILAEAKKKDDADKKADDKKKADKKTEKVEEGFPTVADAKAKAEKEKTTGKFDKKDTSTGTVYTRKSSTFTDGGDDADTKKAKKKAKQDESVEADQFKSKFAKMVAEAKKKKPDANKDGIPDYAQDGKGAKDLGKGKKPAAKDGDDKKSEKKGMSDKQAKYFGKKKSVKESVFEADQEGPADLLAAVEEEINNPGGGVDNLRDVMNATFGADRSPEFKKARAVIGKYLDLVDNAEMGSEEDGIAPMRGGNIARHIQEYDLTDRLAHAAAMLDKVVGGAMGESYKSKKKTVKESVEPKMGFREMMKLVIESGGQQQIDPKDQALFAWATRVAKTKLGEGMKAEVYAGMVYERMGGVFEMYDVLSEAKK